MNLIISQIFLKRLREKHFLFQSQPRRKFFNQFLLILVFLSFSLSTLNLIYYQKRATKLFRFSCRVLDIVWAFSFKSIFFSRKSWSEEKFSCRKKWRNCSFQKGSNGMNEWLCLFVSLDYLLRMLHGNKRISFRADIVLEDIRLALNM